MRAILSKARARLGLVATASLLLLGACASAPEPAPLPGTPPPAAASGAQTGGVGIAPGETVTLALLVPQTAQAEGAARLGRAIANAARLGMAELRDPQLELRVYNTAGQPETARAVAEQALAEGADVFLGPLFAASTEAVSAVAGPAGRRVISFSTITAVAGGPVSLIGYSPESEARRILSYAMSQGRRDVALFYPLNDFGEAAARGARDVPGVQLVATGTYERSFKSIEANSAPFAREARSFAASGVFLPAGGKELQAVGSFLNYHGLDPRRVQYLGLGQWNSRASFQETSLKGGWFPSPDPLAFAQFAARYRARFSAEPPLLSPLGETAVLIAGQLVAAARLDGLADPFSAEAITRPQGFRGALGPIRIFPDGTSENAMAVLEVGEGEFITRDPAPRAVGAGL